MPTQRRRHTITETAPVQDALDRLRAAGITPDLPGLVIRGAQAQLQDAAEAIEADEQRRELRRQLIADAHAGEHGVDLDAALAGERPGWAR